MLWILLALSVSLSAYLIYRLIYGDAVNFRRRFRHWC